MAAKKLVGIALLVGLALLSTACSGGTEVEASKSGDKVAKVEQVSDDDLRAYFDAFASLDADEMDEAKSLAAPDSIAEAYLIHQSAAVNASLDGGLETYEQTVKKVAKGYSVCDPNMENDACATYENFKSNEGKLSSFTINGRDLADRLALGNGKTLKIGNLGTAEFISSYKTAANDLFVILQIESSDEKLDIATYDAKYRAPSGRQSTSTESIGPTELGGNSTATVAMFFPKAESGGEVTLTISDENYTTEKSITVKTR